MSRMDRIERSYLREKVPQFRVGDTVDVHVLIREGEKERIQVFTGTAIRRRGRGTSETFTVRRIVQGQGVERTFPMHSPFVKDVVVRRSGKTRRARLYYLRDRTGKATRLKEIIQPRLASKKLPPKPPAEPAPEAAETPADLPASEPSPEAAEARE